jgi:hypothetical protein
MCGPSFSQNTFLYIHIFSKGSIFTFSLTYLSNLCALLLLHYRAIIR